MLCYRHSQADRIIAGTYRYICKDKTIGTWKGTELSEFKSFIRQYQTESSNSVLDFGHFVLFLSFREQTDEE